MTVTVDSPYFVPSIVEVALTVSVEPDACAASTVNKPDVLISVVPVPPDRLHVTVCAGLFVPVTVAVNCCVAPCSTFAVDGDTVTFVTVGMPVTVNVALTVALAPLVPLTVIISSWLPTANPAFGWTVKVAVAPFAARVVVESVPMS